MGLARTLSLSLLPLLAGGMIAGAASAETPWQAQHPRQEQVLQRSAHQRHAIRAERRQGELSRGQARRLLTADRRIARQDHALSRANGGSISPAQQRVLNREESRVGRHIPG